MPYTTKLLKKETVAEGTMAFRLEKPSGFEYKAGQSADLTLIDPPKTDAEGNTRAFSFSSAPHQDYLMMTTRMRPTAFKEVLKNLPEGSSLSFDGPFGSMTLHNDISKPAVFLAGGIGITPLYSMVKQAAHDRLPHRIFLFYSNRRPEDTAFLKELQDLQAADPNYQLIPTMTDISKSARKWQGETGYINKQMLNKYLGADLSKQIYYMAGPPQMVAALKKMLNEAGINDDYIRFEEFAGY
jgi:ferredoxin-NADP reductase